MRVVLVFAMLTAFVGLAFGYIDPKIPADWIGFWRNVCGVGTVVSIVVMFGACMSRIGTDGSYYAMLASPAALMVVCWLISLSSSAALMPSWLMSGWIELTVLILSLVVTAIIMGLSWLLGDDFEYGRPE